MEHIPVFLEESLLSLNVRELPQGSYLDATFGRGGHSKALLEQLNKSGTLTVCDKDIEAIEIARSLNDPRVHIFHGNYSEVFQNIPENSLDGILADFGLCSYQIDTPQRGFSFLHEGPIDMRMDQSSPLSALDLIKRNTPKTLADIIYKYGEERRSRQMSQEIYSALSENRLKTTLDLAQCARKYYPKNSDKHPATRLFQALRIATNAEFDHIEKFMSKALDALKPQGRLSIITFHSLEYQCVKNFVRQRAEDFRHHGARSALKKVHHPLFPSDKEIESNVRSRSARLHVLTKILQPS